MVQWWATKDAKNEFLSSGGSCLQLLMESALLWRHSTIANLWIAMPNFYVIVLLP